MKSVGETMAIGRTFKESLQKALRGLETGRPGLGLDPRDPAEILAEDEAALTRALRVPNEHRLLALRVAYRAGWSTEDIHEATKIDPWFLENIRELVDFEQELVGRAADARAAARSEAARLHRPPDRARRRASTEADVTALREELGIQSDLQARRHVRGRVRGRDAVLLLDLGGRGRVRARRRSRKIMILGGGPNRIGQGIEFDYCCVHAAFAVQEIGREAVMVNSNPETVSTDYDTTDDLFFEPLTHEDVMNIVTRRSSREGIIVQFGGQTPLNLATGLHKAGAPLIGTSRRVDRPRRGPRALQPVHQEARPAPARERHGARTSAQAFAVARRIGYPVLVRPSYVLGGRAMEIVYDDDALDHYMTNAVQASRPTGRSSSTSSSRTRSRSTSTRSATARIVVIGGMMEHIEEAGHPLRRLDLRAAAAHARPRTIRTRSAARRRRWRRSSTSSA